MPRTADTTKQTEEKRAALLAAARRVLVARGFADIAMEDVARQAGVAKGTLFLYFKSKEDLLIAVFEDLVDQLGASLQRLGEVGLEGRPLLEAAVRTILAHFDENRDFVSQFSSGRLAGCGKSSCGRVMEKFARNYQIMAGLLERCAEDGLIAPTKVNFAASALFGLCRTASMRQAMSGSKAPLERQTDPIVDFFLHGAGKR